MVDQPVLRIIFLVVFFTAAGLSGFYRKRARQRTGAIPRTNEGGAAVIARLFMAVPFLASMLLYGFAPRLMTWASFDLPSWVRWIGVSIAVLCIPLLWWVLRSIGENISETVLIKSSHRLVREGPYRWVRHPLYTAGLLLIGSLALMAGSWFLLAVCAVIAIAFRAAVIPAEERNLTAKFGAEYKAYQLETGALVPRLFQ